MRAKRGGLTMLLAGAMLCIQPARAAEPYHVIVPSAAARTIVLTGRSLTIDQLVDIARNGSKVAIAPELRQGAADSFGLIQQAQAEGVPVYLFNRNAGSGREVQSLNGAPDSPEYQAEIARRYATTTDGELPGFGADLPDEEIGRAMLAVDLNNMRYLAASPAYVQGIADLLNAGVIPAVHARGVIGESDFVPTGAVLRGRGFAYYRGVRMTSAEALAKAGLKPIRFEAADGNLVTTSALTAGYAALLVHDIRNFLEWQDLAWAMNLEGMNGNVGPISLPVQATRPFPWANYAAARALDMLKGSYIFDGEPRIIQDPESLRATVWRDAGAWKAWAQLRDDVLIQMNSTDHNPTIRPDFSPADSWELDTPQLRKFYVKGGKFSHGKHGYVLSNSNWDPFPLADDIEQFPIALNNLMVTVVQRMHRFEDSFFTVADPKVLMHEEGAVRSSLLGGSGGGGAIADALWQELKPLGNPIAPDGVTADKGVGDLDAVPMPKLVRLRNALDIARDILGQDMITAATWMDLRRIENPQRSFGGGSGAALAAFRKVVPFGPIAASENGLASRGDRATAFLQATPAASIYASAAVPMPGGEFAIPPAGPKQPR